MHHKWVIGEYTKIRQQNTPWARVIATFQLTMALILGWTILPAHLALADEVMDPFVYSQDRIQE